MTPAVAHTASPEDKFVIGVDYGTLSGRALVVRVSDGQEFGAAVFHGSIIA